MTLLIVDDSATNLKLLRAQLEAEGVTVIEAANGVEALANLEHKSVDAIISDILMPKMDGYKLCYEMRKDKRFKSTPFIYYTASYTSPADERFALELGANAFLRKPAPTKAILDALNKVLQKPKSNRKPKRPGGIREKELLKEYNERLVAKLEEKNRELQKNMGELYESKKRLSSIYDTVGDVIFHLAVEKDGRYRFISVNNAFVTTTGIDSAHVVGKLVNEIIPEPSLTLVLEKYREAIQGKRIVRWEETSEYPTGKLIGEVSVAPVFNGAGNCTHLVGGVHDITERKQGEEALRQSEEQYRTVTESVNDAIIAIDQDSRIILFANNSIEKIFGYSVSELLGKEITTLMPERYRDEHRAGVKRYVETGVKHLNWKSTQVPGLHKSGKEIPLEISYGEYTKGGKHYFIGVVRDISERVKAEEALRNAEKRYRSTLDHMLEGCQIIGFEWRFLYINDVAAKQGRRNKEELLGRTMMEVFPGIEDTRMFAELRRCMEERIPRRMENEFNFPDGTKGWFHLSMEPVQEGVFILSEDITKEKQLNEELRRHREHLEEMVRERTAQLEAANKELEAFSYSVSHDLRAPLRAIDGFSQLLMEHAPQLDKEAKRFLQTISTNTATMGHLIDDLLAFSRVGRQQMRKWRADMKSLFTGAVQEMKNSEPGRSVEVQFGDLKEAYCDGVLMRQVLANLISNSFKFTRNQPKPTIEVGSYEESNGIVYFVRDNGAGFDMKYADKLFGVFQRLHRQEEFEGTGVGLGIVQRIILRHGGRVWAEGKVNQGATFYFSLPNAGGEESQAQTRNQNTNITNRWM